VAIKLRPLAHSLARSLVLWIRTFKSAVEWNGRRVLARPYRLFY
jgi:hypothetical protein